MADARAAGGLPGGGAFAGSLSAEQQLNAHYTLASLALSGGDYEGALSYLEKCFAYKHLADDALLADLYLKRGYALLCLDRGDEALPELDRCLALSPESADAMLLRMQIYAQKGETEAAFAQAEAYADRYPEQALVYSTLGGLLSAYGEYGAAIRAYTRYLERAENPVPEAYQLRGQSYLQQGQYQEAVADLTVAIEKQPDAEVRARYLRGVAYLQLAEDEAAEEDLTVCVEAIDRLGEAGDEAANSQVDDDVRNSRYYRGVSFMRLGRYAEAIADFTACIRTENNADFAAFWRGCCYLDM